MTRWAVAVIGIGTAAALIGQDSQRAALTFRSQTNLVLVPFTVQQGHFLCSRRKANRCSVAGRWSSAHFYGLRSSYPAERAHWNWFSCSTLVGMRPARMAGDVRMSLPGRTTYH